MEYMRVWNKWWIIFVRLPPSRRSAPYLPKAFSKSAQMMPPARDYRWNLIRNRSTPAAPVAPVPPVSPVTGNLPLGKSPGLQIRPPTMGGYHSQETPLDSHSAVFVGGRWVPQFPGGGPRNTKIERHAVTPKAAQVKRPKLGHGETFPSSFPPVKEEPKSPNIRESSPPVHGVIPADRSLLQNSRGNERITHPVIRIPPEGNVQEREVLLPYAQMGAGGVTTIRRRPRQLAPGETSRS